MVNILTKALTATPLPDFNLCISLIDERPINATLDEPDPLPVLLPALKNLHNLLYRCRFPAFWEYYRSIELENLRDNYTVECVGFENAIRDVAVQAVKATFTRISSERLGSYLDIHGLSFLLFHHIWELNFSKVMIWNLIYKSKDGLKIWRLVLSVFHLILIITLKRQLFTKT